MSVLAIGHASNYIWIIFLTWEYRSAAGAGCCGCPNSNSGSFPVAAPKQLHFSASSADTASQLPRGTSSLLKINHNWSLFTEEEINNFKEEAQCHSMRKELQFCQVLTGKKRNKWTASWKQGRWQQPGRNLSILLPLLAGENVCASPACCLQPNSVPPAATEAFSEDFKLSNYLSYPRSSESQLETIRTKHKYSSVQKKVTLKPLP